MMSTAMIDQPASLSFRLLAIGFCAVAALLIPAQIHAADPTANVANLTLPAVSYSHAAQTTTGTMTLTIDSSTNSAGWNVTILTSAFVYSGANSGTNIAAANFSLSSAAAPLMTTGQAVDATGGPKVPGTSPVGSLDEARKTVKASAGFGQGTYTQALGVSLNIPARSRAGTYTGTLTTTIAATP